MIQSRRVQVRAGRRSCSALLAQFGHDRTLEDTLQGLKDVQMDPVERPAGGLCIKSTIGDRPFGRSIFVFRKPHRIQDTLGEFRKPG